MPQTLSIKKQHLKAGASYVKQVHCINFLVICQKGEAVFLRKIVSPFMILTGFELNSMPLINYISLKSNDPDYMARKIDEV
jgi:hypothetical protein